MALGLEFRDRSTSLLLCRQEDKSRSVSNALFPIWWWDLLQWRSSVSGEKPKLPGLIPLIIAALHQWKYSIDVKCLSEWRLLLKLNDFLGRSDESILSGHNIPTNNDFWSTVFTVYSFRDNYGSWWLQLSSVPDEYGIWVRTLQSVEKQDFNVDVQLIFDLTYKTIGFSERSTSWS